jgi:exosortase A-associated hydrolase 1
MRRVLNFDCEGASLAASLDDAERHSGLLIVSGGNEIRIGAHRGMAKLAADVANEGYPVFRFDRRGIGDSEGENSGFSGSGPDIASAVAAFRNASPNLRHVVAFGNCDAASALVLHSSSGLDAMVLANIWVIEPTDDLPPPVAIRARYVKRLRDPKAWARLFTGAINIKKLISGLWRIAQPAAPSSLSKRVVAGINALNQPVAIILAKRDVTAITFAHEWEKTAGAAHVSLTTIDSASHSFASERDYAVLLDTILATLKRL